MEKKQYFLLVLGFLCLGWGGVRVAHYFLDKTPPTIELRGMEINGVYAGDIACTLTGYDGYKIDSVSLLLDGEPLVEEYAVCRKQFAYPFVLSTDAFADGEHTLKVIVVDGSYRRNESVLEIPFFVDNVPLNLAWVTREKVFRVFQGKTLHVQFQASKPLGEATAEFLNGRYPCFQEREDACIYEAFIPVKSDERPSEYPLSIRAIDRVGVKGVLEGRVQVVSFPFKSKKCELGRSLTAAERGALEPELAQDLQIVFAQSHRVKRWKGLFESPCHVNEQELLFGTACFSPEKGYGRAELVDLIGDSNGAVWASQDGVIALKKTYPKSGNIIAIDHGFGIVSLYLNLGSFSSCTEGDSVTKGTVIGRLQKIAGRPQFSWGIRVNDIAVDPVQWTHQGF
ncbi:MAG: M23 family metallopeptidase [Candidatus Babeliaceae bacterium]|nr:M23 family metallopeptidase [Candidatus Babeliaceae bacterium]